MEIRYPEYFWVKATMVIPYTCGLNYVDVKKYQQPPRAAAAPSLGAATTPPRGRERKVRAVSHHSTIHTRRIFNKGKRIGIGSVEIR